MVKIQCLVLVELGVFNVRYAIEKLGYSFEQEVAYFSLQEKQQKLTVSQQEEVS